MPNDRPVVLLTDPLHARASKRLNSRVKVLTARGGDMDELRQLAGGVHGIIVRSQLPPDIMDHAPLLKGIVRHGVGVDMIPVDAATKRGIPVANLPGVNTRAVVEYCIAAIMALRRDLRALDSRLRSVGWQQSRTSAAGMREIGGNTLGILGLGRIGSRLARTTREVLGMSVLGHSLSGRTTADFATITDLKTLFARSDIVVICCDLTAITHGLVGARLIHEMQPHAHLINVSRGQVVNSDDLVQALVEGQIAGAALDVFDSEPLPATSPMLSCPNLILTPHIAGITSDSAEAMGEAAVDEMLRILDGQAPLSQVNAAQIGERE